jgi:hypothetical protein
MKIRHVVAAVSVAGALTLPASASAAEPGGYDPPSQCPKGFTPFLDPINGSGADDNGNMIVCVRTTAEGDVFVDDRG